MSTTQSGRTSQSTIGNTSISTREEEIIKKEVRDAIKRIFPGIKIGEKFQPELSPEQAELNTGDSQTSVIDLTKKSGGSL